MTRQFSFSAQVHPTFPESLNECLTKLESYVDGNQVLGIIFFVDSNSDAEYFEMKRAIQSGLDQKKMLFPFNVQAQSFHSMLSVEIWLDDAAHKTEYISYEGIRYTRSTSAYGKSIWGIGITQPNENAPLVGQIDFSFETACNILEQEGMTLADIVRQWNYIPGILNIQEMEEKSLQHYQIFNEIRQKFYSSFDFRDGYPSATGIGTRNGNYDLDFYAVKSSSSLQKVGLSNPKQQDAYNYDQKYLIGDTITGRIKKTPLFERAKLLKTPKDTVVFISGTASIIGQDTIGIGDVRLQTETTINNMQELIPINNEQSVQFTYLRAYIKEVADYSTVRGLCEAKFPNMSVSYLQADVCRDNLLVEIEGAAVVV